MLRRQTWSVVSNAVERLSKFMTKNHSLDLSLKGLLVTFAPKVPVRW